MARSNGRAGHTGRPIGLITRKAVRSIGLKGALGGSRSRAIEEREWFAGREQCRMRFAC